jgi:hypothetical protein
MNIDLPSLIIWPPVQNWRTSTVGVLMVIAGVASLMHIQIQGVAVTTDPWTLITGGIGFIFAKDGVTHSTLAQVEKSTAQASAATAPPAASK